MRRDPAAMAALLPDFLGLGAPRAGTTWLYRLLRAHPGVFVPRVKELRYFSRYADRGPAWYAWHFREAEGRVRGEISTEYGALPLDRIRDVHALVPEARLVYVLRHPVERAWSHACHELAARSGKDPASVDEQAFVEYLEGDGVHRHGDYAAIVARWDCVFAPEQLHIALYDDIVADPATFARGVLAHLGVDAEVDLDALGLRRVVNRSGAPPIPPGIEAALNARYAADIDALRASLAERRARGGPGPAALPWTVGVGGESRTPSTDSSGTSTGGPREVRREAPPDAPPDGSRDLPRDPPPDTPRG